MGLSTALKNYIKIISLIIITLFILYILHLSLGSIFDFESDNTHEFEGPTIMFE